MGGEDLVELDRSQAISHLNQRIESLSSVTAATTEPTNKAAKDSPSSTESSLPFFEIYEELDESGREVKAEAINVAKQLEFLQQREGKTPNAFVVPSVSADEEMPHDDEPKKLKPVTDTEYEVLSSRLHMLARLEEDTEIAKAENQASAKKLQSKGWSKGFLNAKPKKKKSQQKKIPALAPEQSSGKARKVAFKAEEEVREIPRVGMRSASKLKSAATTPPRREIEQQVFSGVIRERSVGSATESSLSTSPPVRKKLSRFAHERLNQQH
jgi:hypothetical protein